MPIIIRSPFKYNSIESDPTTYGLREDVLQQCFNEIFNDNNLLISGPRGIGKSSLSVQLQKVLGGDKRLLTRCGLVADLPKYILLQYVCYSTDTLEDIVLSLLSQLEIKLNEKNSTFKIIGGKLDLSFFGIVRGEIEVKKNTLENNIIIDKFIEAIIHTSYVIEDPHINILIDEVDQLGESINFAHFLKVVCESLDRRQYTGLSFIVIGQDRVYSRLLRQQPAFERIINPINLGPLDSENSEYVFDACLQSSDQTISFDPETRGMLLDIASGYPYIIHLLGHYSIYNMQTRYNSIPETGLLVNQQDFLEGLRIVIDSKKEMYNQIIDNCSDSEKTIIFSLVVFSTKSIPQVYIYNNIVKLLKNNFLESEVLPILDSLCNNGILKVVTSFTQEKAYIFDSELFRIYVADKIQQKEIEVHRLKDIDYPKTNTLKTEYRYFI